MKNKRKIAVIISAALVLTAVMCTTPALAKYITTQGEQSDTHSQSFYFTSGYLQEGEIPEYEISGDSVTFTVQNYVDSLRVSPTDIPYTVTATDGTLSSSGGTLTGNSSDSDTITLSYDGGEADKEITVTAASTEPYRQVLQAKFILAKSAEGVKYEIKDQAGSYFAELYIYTGDTPQTVNLSWDNAELLIDETNDYVFGRVINQASPEKSTAETGEIATDTTVKIVFFKNDIDADYTCGLQKSDGTITVYE